MSEAMRGEQETARFREAMLERFNDSKNANKGCWKNSRADTLFHFAAHEMKELSLELDRVPRDPERIRKEAADIAAYCLMIADVTGGLDE